jgi:hypothetical protein
MKKLAFITFAMGIAPAAAEPPPDFGVPQAHEQSVDTAPPLVAAPLQPEDLNVDLSPIDDRGVIARNTVPPTVRVPIAFAASVFAAGYGYAGHPTRTAGFESQARGDAWQGLEWGLHAAYTVDVIDADDSSSGTYSATAFHDVNLGGSGLITDRVWSFIEIHLLRGANEYGQGVAFMGGLGRSWGVIKTELGVGALVSNGDKSVTLNAHVVAPHVNRWLGAGLVVLYTNDAPYNMNVTTGGSKIAAGPELMLGPFRKFSISVDGLLGDRESAMVSRGQVVENTADVDHLTGRAFLWWNVSPNVRAYLGGSLRTATAPANKDYTLASGFAGTVVTL